ncbi:MAG: hypothetical protein R2867_37870 [Caldilineaceae bacterium]
MIYGPNTVAKLTGDRRHRAGLLGLDWVKESSGPLNGPTLDAIQAEDRIGTCSSVVGLPPLSLHRILQRYQRAEYPQPERRCVHQQGR